VNAQTKLRLTTATPTEPPAEPAAPRPTTLEGLDRKIAEIEAKTDMDWNNDPSVFIAEQPRTAIYWNPRHQLVIRQERGPLEEDDTFVFFSPDGAAALITVLQAELKSDPDK
jgi:hypothetical protein